LPVFKQLYKSVVTGIECKEVLCDCGAKDYKERLDKQLDAMGNSEMWQAGKACRSLRPNEKARKNAANAVGTKGRAKN